MTSRCPATHETDSRHALTAGTDERLAAPVLSVAGASPVAMTTAVASMPPKRSSSG
jgi:hypothetical protein